MHHHYQHIAFCLTTGQPYNQLAILASGKGDELATVYYYCRRCVKIIIKDTVKLQKNIAKNTNCNLLTHENQQQTHPAYRVDPGTRTRPHWWEAHALSTAPSLLATLFLRLLLETGPPFYRFIQVTRWSSRARGKGSTFIFQS